MLNAGSIDRAMWNSDTYSFQLFGFSGRIKCLSRGFFEGRIFRRGSLVHSSINDDLKGVVNSINNFLETVNYEPQYYGSKDVCRGVPGASDFAVKQGQRPGATHPVNAGIKPQNLGHSQAKNALDWGEDKQRKVHVCH